MKETCKRLDAVDARFICIGDGGILESVNPFPPEPRFAELGAKAGVRPILRLTRFFFFFILPLDFEACMSVTLRVYVGRGDA